MYPPKVGRCLILTATMAVALHTYAAPGQSAPSRTAKDARYVPDVPPLDASTLVRANDAFALDVYSQLRTGSGNLFFSPYSVALVLAVTGGGARGRTAVEIDRVLHLTGSPEAIAEAFALHTAGFEPDEMGGNLVIANSLWGPPGAGFQPAFLHLAKRYYAATVRTVDFARDAGAARDEINDWVATATRRKITSLIGPGGVNARTRLVVCNAIYFKGRWQQAFHPDATMPAEFTLGNGASIEVPTMTQRGHFRLLHRDRLDLLEMPYQDAGLSMVILLPAADDGLTALERRLTAAALDGWLGALARATPTAVDVSLPKFRFSQAVSLARPLRRLGLATAFDPARADFSGLGAAPGLFISEIVHKACIDVDEEGTVAAAATAETGTLGALYHPDDTPRFDVDHPFLFLIRDNADGGILFLGRVLDPR